jgi:hypothetical protein
MFCFLERARTKEKRKEKKKKRNSSPAVWHDSHSAQASGAVLCYKKII